MNGIYIHIPFCKSKCPYCDFHSGVCKQNEKKLYVEAVINELKTLHRCKDFLPNFIGETDTIYLGGGTPSILCGEDIERIVNTAKENFNLSQNSEITIECNPGSPIEELTPHFIKCGINRISLGLQSAVDSERKILGRSSNKDRVKEVVSFLQQNGITNISLDVMLGIPEQTKHSLKETLDFVIECGVSHISAYILKIEEGSFFDTHRERYKFPSDDESADLYEFCSSYLTENGYEHYEISNFAKKGFESKHNTKYWKLDNYLGIGAGAHSYFNGKRFYFESDNQSFIDGNPPIFDGIGGSCDEYIMLRLRLKEGLNLNNLKELYGNEITQSIKTKIPTLEKQELINFSNSTIALTTKGMLLSNYVICELI